MQGHDDTERPAGHRSTAGRLGRSAAKVGRALAALVVVSVGLTLTPADAADQGKADWPGCGNDTGVTVVVDMTALGGDVVVRCASGPGGSGYTGLDALEDAGFSVTGTQRWGKAFVCRIQGRPSASESLVIPGDDDYRERCANTPPQTAYWGYWYASNGGSWKYSSSSASSRSTTAGGFEGWSFSLQSSGETGPPAFTPVRPKWTESDEPDSGAGSGDGGDGGGGGDGPSGGSGPGDSGPGGSGPTGDGRGDTSDREPPIQVEGEQVPTGGQQSPDDPETTPTTDDPTADVQVTGELPDQPESTSASGGSAAPIVGFGLLAALAAGAGVTAWRRSHRG